MLNRSKIHSILQLDIICRLPSTVLYAQLDAIVAAFLAHRHVTTVCVRGSGQGANIGPPFAFGLRQSTAATTGWPRARIAAMFAALADCRVVRQPDDVDGQPQLWTVEVGGGGDLRQRIHLDMQSTCMKLCKENANQADQ